VAGAGGSSSGGAAAGGHQRVELFRQALQNGKNLTFVGSLQNDRNIVQNQPFPKKHEGHGGYTIDSGSGISGSITDQALANFHPNIVLLMIGTNDINGNVDVANAPKRLGKQIDDITTREPNAFVVVATIIPIANDGTNPKVQTYSAACQHSWRRGRPRASTWCYSITTPRSARTRATGPR